MSAAHFALELLGRGDEKLKVRVIRTKGVVKGEEDRSEMAEIAVNLAIDKLVPLLVEETKLLGGVRREVTDIKDELEFIRAFLRDADARIEGNDEVVKVWVKQVREIAFDIEDVLDDFELRLAQQPHRRGFVGELCKVGRLVKFLKPRHVIATDIQDIKARLDKIKQRSERYHFDIYDQGSSSNTGGDYTCYDPRLDALYTEEAELVGIEKPENELIRWLEGGVPRRTVFAVVGMGGVGKTTLTKKVYDSQPVRRHFKCHAWITVSQSFNVEEVLKTLIKQFYESMKESIPEGVDAMDKTRLINVLREYLQPKRYVAVFDDVWDVNFWNSVKNALIDNNCGSRILVTTREGDVAYSCVEYSNHIYDLHPLPHKESLDLFLKKAFGSKFGGNCPPDLLDLSDKIAKKCNGLPLAIVAIGGLLFRKDKTVYEWKKLYDSLAFELEENPNLTSIMKILSLSYNNLPYYLKPCFLYFGIFPEDRLVHSNALTRLWIAEGFVREKPSKTIEEVAKDYLNELIHRNLVQVEALEMKGNVTGCRVHDLMRDFILSRFEMENFCKVLYETNNSLREKIRRLSMHRNIENVPESMNLSGMRSLFMFGIDKLPKPLMRTLLSNSLLKVLDLQDAPMEDFPYEVTNLFHLRFLNLSNTRIRKLPKSIGKLQNLLTLDITRTRVIELPNAFLKLRKLRHLLAFHADSEAIKVPEGIGCLTCLQTLIVVDVNEGARSIITDLGKLTQLKMLNIENLRRESGSNLCISIAKMNDLESLSVSSIEKDEFLDLQFTSSPPPSLLQYLYLTGRLENLPDWIPNLQNLVKIYLGWSILRDDPMKVLGASPNLMELWFSNHAYAGEQLRFEAGKFKRLKILRLFDLDKLNSVIVEEGTLPVLEELKIGPSEQLMEVPLGITNLTNLKVLYFAEMPEEFTRRLARDGGEDYWKVKHIAEVSFENWCDGGWVVNHVF